LGIENSIVARQDELGSGKAIVETLAKDLQKTRTMSARNQFDEKYHCRKDS